MTTATMGFEALARAQWEEARDALERALAEGDESPEVLDALARALWWLRDPQGAVVQRERAYAGFRRSGELARAARIALWLSREYGQVWRNEAAANGWLSRAARLLQDVAAGTEDGWLALTRSERASEPATAAGLAAEALEVATRTGDADLELRSLAQLGLTEVSLGNVEAGLAHLDEAMAAATSGEADSLETFADVCCTLLQACELAGDDERPRQWTEVFERFVREYDHVPLLAFCRTCGAQVSAAGGRIDDAEQELVAALHDLAAAGQHARCVHPAARLAEIRILQGRFDEAETLLEEHAGRPETIPAAIALRLARAEPQAATALAEQRLAELPETSPALAPLLAQLVEARLMAGDVASARLTAASLQDVANRVGSDRMQATASLARARVATGGGEAAAPDLLRDAVRALEGTGLALDAARARLELARTLVDSAPELAVDAAARSRRELDALGVARDADAAASLLRSLGAKGASGPRDHGTLTKRELEVLRLLGEGLSNAEIGHRLFISPKTAEHHVSRIYGKLSLRNRGEAAAYAARHLGAG